MRWEDERYVRVYTRDTTDWIALGWEAQSLFLLMLRKVDRAGVLELGRSGERGLAALVGMPVDVVQRALPILLADGCVAQGGTALVMPNFIKAQEATQTDKARKQAQRERDRARAMAASRPERPDPPPSGPVTGGHAESHAVTNSDQTSQNVTVSHAPSREVTGGHAESHAVTPCLAVPDHAGEGDAHAHTHARETDPPPPPPAVADPSPEVPPTGSWGGLPEVSCATVERPNELVADSILDALLRASDGRVDIRGPAQTTAAFVRAVREARYTLAEIATLGRYVAAGECAWARRTRFDLGFFIATDRNGVIRLSELVTKAIEWNAERTAPRPAPAPVLRVVPSARVLSSEERVSGFAAARRMLEARGAAALSAGEPTTEEHRDG